MHAISSLIERIACASQRFQRIRDVPSRLQLTTLLLQRSEVITEAPVFPDNFQIIDISQPVTSATACFPGDVPFTKQLTVSFAQSNVINLTALTMSPHVGTHADAPSHIRGTIEDGSPNIGSLELSPYIGNAVVVDLSPMSKGPVTAAALESALATAGGGTPQRVLVKTQQQINYDKWEGDYPYFSLDAIDFLAKNGVDLVGIDTPSVDQVDAKVLETHHRLDAAGMVWLENLDLTRAKPGRYFLFAAPLKLMELEASPVRAVLLGSA